MKDPQQHTNRTFAKIILVAASVICCGSSTIAAPPVVVAPESLYVQPESGHTKPYASQAAKNVSVAANHILVKLGAGVQQSEVMRSARDLGARKLKKLATTNWYVMTLAPQGNSNPRDRASAVRGLSGVISAVADPIVQINDLIPPTDPFYVDDPDPGVDCDVVEDPNCAAEDLVDQWGLFKVGAESAWYTHTGSSDVVIAVLDSGIDVDHDDLWDNLWVNDAEVTGIEGVDDDGNGKIDDKRGYDFAGNNVGSPTDDPMSEDPNPDIFSLAEHQWISDPSAVPFGYRFDGDAAVGDGIDNNLEFYPLFFTMDIGVFHGTGVAGVAGMMANNINPETGTEEGMVGACWHCQIMNVRTINAEGEALGSDIVEAIYYAVDNGADIINASWGVAPGGATAGELAPIEEAIQYAVANDVVFIAAAGNGGEAGLYFPASMPETIAVGSSNWLDSRSDFSTYAQGAEILDVVAPGELIWTSGVMSAYDAWVANFWLLFPELWYEPWRPGDDTYNGGDGTSFAAPLVSGYAGLILSRNSCATAEDVRQIIRDNAIDVGTPGYDAQTGFGRIQMVVPDLGCGIQDDPPSISVSAPAGPLSGNVEVIAVANDDNGVLEVEFFVDGNSLGVDNDPADGWSWQWDSTGTGDGTRTLTATAMDTIGQTASDSINVEVDNVNEPPIAIFSYSCTDLTCSFDASASSDPDPSDSIVTYTWDFGDFGSDAGATAVTSHDYASAGTYDVTLIVSDGVNDSTADTQSVTVTNFEEPPVLLVTASDNEDGTANITWNETGEVQLQREKKHAKRDVWQSLSDLGSVTGGSYTDATGEGTFRYRASRDGAQWSAWSEVTVSGGGGGGGNGNGGGKGGGKPNR